MVNKRGNCKTHLPVKTALLRPFAFLLLDQPASGWRRRSDRGSPAATYKWRQNLCNSLKKLLRPHVLFITMFVLFIAAVAQIDRIFFKRSSSFCPHFLYSCLPANPDWDLPTPTSEETLLLDPILNQKFHYFAKGTRCFAFVSDDQKYVIKFHRYPSHMRLFPWLTHPFSYSFTERRKKIKEYNLKRIQANFRSYKNSYFDLKEETGILLLHINRTDHLRKTITIVDKAQAEHKISLDDVTFILQKRADLIYPALDRLVQEKKYDEAKQTVSQIIHLVAKTCQKGYIDKDPVLKRNYGLLEDRAIHIDVGDLIKNEGIALRESYIPYIKEMTESLRKQLESSYTELLEHYHQIIQDL